LHIQRQLLHCWKYQFQDLDGKMLSFEAPEPLDFEALN